jgi:pSer/pThr/pTyr-binding forkhead associated (FHA) protein
VKAVLVWTREEGEPLEFPLDGAPVEVGRDEAAAVRIDEPLVSRRHARIERRGESWFVVDLDSTNFTRVNGHRLRREHELEDGDRLQFARARCLFRVVPPGEPAG